MQHLNKNLPNEFLKKYNLYIIQYIVISRIWAPKILGHLIEKFLKCDFFVFPKCEVTL